MTYRKDCRLTTSSLTRRAPISLFIFLFSMSLLEGLNGDETRERFKNQYFSILFVNWQIWPLFQVSLPRVATQRSSQPCFQSCFAPFSSSDASESTLDAAV